MQLLEKASLIWILLTSLAYGQLTSPQSEWIENYGVNQILYVNESPADMKMDSEGYIYVTGTGNNDSIRDDIIVVKLDSMGNTIWKKYIDFGSDEIAKTILIDQDDNIYISGIIGSVTNTVYARYFLIKLDKDGNELWSAAYDAIVTLTAESTTYLSAIFDNDFNIILVGINRELSTTGDANNILILKYSKEGELLWDEEYEHPTDEFIRDIPQAITVDNSNNILILKHCDDYSSEKLSLLKYSPEGKFIDIYEIVSNVYPGATLTKDENGNLIISYTLHHYEFYIAKFTPKGFNLWEWKYPEEDMLQKKKISVNSSGNIAVSISNSITNYMYTALFDTNGNLLWNQQFMSRSGNGSFVYDQILDNNNDIYILGADKPEYSIDDYTSTYNEYMFLKYNSDGNISFSEYYHDVVYLLVKNEPVRLIKKNSKFFITGMSSHETTANDIAILKYSDSGTLEAFKRIEGTSVTNNRAVALELNPQGYPITLSSSYKIQQILNLNDFCITKTDNYGNSVWTDLYNESWLYNNTPADMAVDDGSNIYVVGSKSESGSNADIVTIKYSPAGARIWTRIFDNEENGSDQAQKILIDRNGDIIIGGSSTSTVSQTDYVIVKYSQNGEEIWRSYYNSLQNADDKFADMCIDSLNNIYVTGTSKVSEYQDIITLKYDENGTLIWDYLFDGPSNKNDIPNTIKIDPHGSIYVGGSEVNGSFLLIKFDNDGLLKWYKIESANYHGTGITDIAFDKKNNIYVTGEMDQNYTPNCFTIKYSDLGELNWKKEFSNTWGGRKIELDSDENIYVLDASAKLSKLLSDGQIDWTYEIPRQSYIDSLADYTAIDMSLDSENNIYIFGHQGKDHSSMKTFLNRIKQINTAFPPNFKTTILQNPAASKYCDIVVAADTSLKSTPKVTISNSIDTTWLEMSGINGLKSLYKGPYTFTVSGPHYLETQVTGLNGLDSANTREINVVLAKREENSIVIIPENLGYLDLKHDSIKEDMYITAYHEYEEKESTYTFGPIVDLNEECKLTLHYDTDKFVQDKIPAIFFKSKDEWIPLKTDVDPQNGTVWTNITKLGVYKVDEKIDQNVSTIPGTYCLYQNFPNPFNSSTMIKYDLPHDTFVSIEIYNILGQKIKRLEHAPKRAGVHFTSWDGTDNRNKSVSSGIYIYSLKSKSFTISKRLLILK